MIFFYGLAIFIAICAIVVWGANKFNANILMNGEVIPSQWNPREFKPIYSAAWTGNESEIDRLWRERKAQATVE